jgi:Flp pilus assembly protein TadD|tara:strand:+ start:229 stop:687 length:459 start_codon:yes stop_codon:yes gene_type:complete
MSSKLLQLLILTSALCLIYVFYQLPTSVIENKNSKEEMQKAVSVEQALSLIEGANPMEGVFMLRDIIENNPKDTEALYYLGVLSNQTGQYENAAERFNQLITIDSSDKRAYLQLGISNYNLGDKEKADSLFNIVINSNDELLIKELDNFLTN